MNINILKKKLKEK